MYDIQFQVRSLLQSLLAHLHGKDEDLRYLEGLRVKSIPLFFKKEPGEVVQANLINAQCHQDALWFLCTLDYIQIISGLPPNPPEWPGKHAGE